jgi:hypothetical protein
MILKTILIIFGIAYLFLVIKLVIKDIKEKKAGVKQRLYEHP